MYNAIANNCKSVKVPYVSSGDGVMNKTVKTKGGNTILVKPNNKMEINGNEVYWDSSEGAVYMNGRNVWQGIDGTGSVKVLYNKLLSGVSYDDIDKERSSNGKTNVLGDVISDHWADLKKALK